MYILNPYKTSIFVFLTDRTTKGYLISFILFIVTAALVALSQISVGVPVMTGRPWDVLVVLDGAWRILNGQIPHNDFFSTMGALPFYIAYWGMTLQQQPSIYSIVLSNLIVMSVITTTAFYLFWRRISAVNCYLFAVFFLLLIVTPRPIGEPYFFNDYAMLYNRFAEAIVMLFSIGIIFHREQNKENAWIRYGDIVILGVLLMSLLFIKTNYVAVAFAVIMITIILRLHSVWLYIGLAGSSLVTLLLILHSTGISFSKMLNDFSVVIAAQSFSTRVVTLIINFITNMQYFFLLLVLCIEVSMDSARQINKRRLYELLAIVIVFSCCALVLLSSNTQREELPLLSVAALCCFERARMGKKSGSYATDSEFYRYVILFLIMLLFLIPTFGRDLYAMRSYYFSAVINESELRKPLPFLEKTNLHDFLISSREWVTRSTMGSYAEELQEGLKLIQKSMTKDMKLRVIGFDDPYTFALGLKPVKGGSTCLDRNIMSKKSHPPLSMILGSATHVFISKEYYWYLNEVFTDEMSQYHFESISESQHFNIYKIS